MGFITFLTNLDPAIQAALVIIAVYVADAIVTWTPNPLDNIILRAFKAYQEKKAR